MRGSSSPAQAAPHLWFIGLLDAVGSQPLGSSLRQCPNPDHAGDAQPSLSVTTRDGGGARLHCFAGCPERDILRALGLGVRQLYSPPTVSPARFAAAARLQPAFPPVVHRSGHPAALGYRLEAVHRYGPATDARGGRITGYRLLRWRSRTGGDKELMWETRLADGTGVPGLMGTPLQALPLYREYEVGMAVHMHRLPGCAYEPVLVVESESSADALRGWYATTWAGGAHHVNTERLLRVLGGHPYTILMPDFDPAGLACLHRMLAAGLGPATLLGVPGEDARDLYRRLGNARFADAVQAALRRGPAASSSVLTASDRRLVQVALPDLPRLLAGSRGGPSPGMQPWPMPSPAGPRPPSGAAARNRPGPRPGGRNLDGRSR